MEKKTRRAKAEQIYLEWSCWGSGGYEYGGRVDGDGPIPWLGRQLQDHYGWGRGRPDEPAEVIDANEEEE